MKNTVKQIMKIKKDFSEEGNFYLKRMTCTIIAYPLYA